MTGTAKVELLDQILAECRHVEPRDYQRRIVTKAANMLTGRHVGRHGVEPAVNSVLIESPTGSGKTCMAMLALKLLQHEIPDLHIGWIAMRRELLHQAAREHEQKGFGLRNLHFLSMFVKEPPMELVQAPHRMILCDESHHSAADSCAHLFNVIKPTLSLGLTATPFRVDRMRLCFQKVIKDAGIHQLIQLGYLARYWLYVVPKWTPQVVAERYLAEPERWGKSVMFFQSIRECRECCDILVGQGIRAEVISGDSDRERQLADFAGGHIKVLINCMVLTEGFDSVDLQTVWVRDASKGPSIQMGGRVLRRCSTLPYKQIVQSQETRCPFTKIASPTQQFVWSGWDWRSVTINPHIEALSRRMCYVLATTPYELPEFLRRKSRRSGRRREVETEELTL
jgi:superfamily II DNA or RNA helicase